MVGLHKLQHTARYCAHKRTCFTSKKRCVNRIKVNQILHCRNNGKPHIKKSIDISSFIQLASYLSFSPTWTLLTSIRSSRAFRRFPALLVPPGHEQGGLQWCHGSRRKTRYRHSAPTLGFRLWHPLVWQTARKQGTHKNTLPLKCAHNIEMWVRVYVCICVCVCVCVCVLTCLQDTSAPELLSVHPVPHVAPSPAAQNTPWMLETTWTAECPGVSSTHLCDFWGFYSSITEGYGLLGCDSALLGKWLLTFQGNVFTNLWIWRQQNAAPATEHQVPEDGNLSAHLWP
jgi:hypothetical protein